MLMKTSKVIIGNRTRDLPACSAVSQTTAPLRTPETFYRVQFLSQLPYEIRNDEWQEYLSQYSSCNKGILVHYTSSLTQLYYLFYQYIGLTTACFGPACGPSSGCNFDSRSSYTMCGVILCQWGLGGGTRSRYYTIGYFTSSHLEENTRNIQQWDMRFERKLCRSFVIFWPVEVSRGRLSESFVQRQRQGSDRRSKTSLPIRAVPLRKQNPLARSPSFLHAMN